MGFLWGLKIRTGPASVVRRLADMFQNAYGICMCPYDIYMYVSLMEA